MGGSESARSTADAEAAVARDVLATERKRVEETPWRDHHRATRRAQGVRQGSAALVLAGFYFPLLLLIACSRTCAQRPSRVLYV